MKAGMFAAALAAVIVSATPVHAQIKTAKVTGGAVEGTVADGLSTYLGIPFAAPPVGDLRWKAPQPVKPWAGLKKANHFGAGCMQEPGLAKQMGFDGTLSEDCLFIDVWTPAKAPTAKLPVMVWIYGGGFNSGMTGVPLYNGANMAKQGIVVVSVSYRVGPFGFISSPELSKESGHGSGNYGMLDMIAGLKWVQANVAKFGGDPAKVTIMGHSAGAMAVSRLTASPLAKGLFRAAIAQSGANFTPQTSLAGAEAIGTKFLSGLGANDLKAARALTAAQIEAAADARGAPRFPLPLDGYVVPGDQRKLWPAGRFNDTPVLFGHTSDEAVVFGPSKTTSADFEKMIRSTYGAHADALLAAYPHATDEEASRSNKYLRRDTSFGWNEYAWARLQAAHGKGKAYVYYFDRPTAQAPDGSGHGSEVALVFANPDARRAAWTDEDKALSNEMQGYWVNFAKTLDPNGPGLPAWPAFTTASPQVMRLGKVNAPDGLPNLDKMQALDGWYTSVP